MEKSALLNYKIRKAPNIWMQDPERNASWSTIILGIEIKLECLAWSKGYRKVSGELRKLTEYSLLI